jgi:hypothetical protein
MGRDRGAVAYLSGRAGRKEQLGPGGVGLRCDPLPAPGRVGLPEAAIEVDAAITRLRAASRARAALGRLSAIS